MHILQFLRPVSLAIGSALVPFSPPLSPALAQEQGDSSTVAAVVERYHHALAAGDTAAVLALLSPSAIILGESSHSRNIGRTTCPPISRSLAQ